MLDKMRITIFCLEDHDSWCNIFTIYQKIGLTLQFRFFTFVEVYVCFERLLRKYSLT